MGKHLPKELKKFAWQPGVKPPGAGGKKGMIHYSTFTEALKDLIYKGDIKPADIVKAMARRAKRFSDRAADSLMDRVDGPVPHNIALTGDVKITVNVTE